MKQTQISKDNRYITTYDTEDDDLGTMIFSSIFHGNIIMAIIGGFLALYFLAFIMFVIFRGVI